MASFNFGNTSSLGASNQAAKPAGFGSFGFGSPAATSAPAFGAPTAAAPAFGSSFGAPAASVAPTQFGFGSTATATTSVASTFGGFGAQAPTASVAPTNSFGFGASNTTAGVGGFGGFGAPTASVAPTGIGAFGAPATTFGGFGGGGAFGAAASSQSLTLGGFGNTTTTSTAGGFGSFGSTFGKPGGTAGAFGQSAFGQPQQQQQSFQMGQQQPQQPPPPTAEEAFAQSILNVAIYGDERDAVIAKWNYLQAQWGTGKSFYTAQAPPLDITAENQLCRFKAMGYSKLPGHDNKLGYVALNVARPADQVRAQEQQLADQLRQVFGSRPTIQVRIHTVRALSDTRAQCVIYVEERTGAGVADVKRIPATEVAAYLQQPQPKQQLATGLGVEQVLASVLPDDDQLREYLETAPKGIDGRMWRQAITDNPDATRLIPVPIIGCTELKWRIRCQEVETATHTQYLQKVQRDVAELKQRHASTVAKIMEHRRKFGDLAHRVLQIVVKQECSRKLGVALTPEEEVLRSKFENMQALVSAPTQFKGRLSELLSQMRMQRNQWNTFNVAEYTLDKDATDEMKSFLSMQQKAMSFLIETVNKDMKSLRIISDGIKEIVRD